MRGTTEEPTGIHQRLRSALADAADADGIDTRGLRPGDSVVIRTCHSVYSMRIADPQQGEATARGSGSHLTSDTPVRVVGASLSGRGSLVKSGWVLRGYKLLMSVPDGELLTSSVREIWVNGAPLREPLGTH